MSRIILSMYPGTDEAHIVVGWDRPCASYFWQEFNKEPEVETYKTPSGKWRGKGVKGEFDHKDEVKWASPQADGWEEMLRYAGYNLNELPTMQAFMNSVPRDIEPLVTEEVRKLLQRHSMDPDAGRIVVDLTDNDHQVA